MGMMVTPGFPDTLKARWEANGYSDGVTAYDVEVYKLGRPGRPVCRACATRTCGQAFRHVMLRAHAAQGTRSTQTHRLIYDTPQIQPSDDEDATEGKVAASSAIEDACQKVRQYCGKYHGRDRHGVHWWLDTRQP